MRILLATDAWTPQVNGVVTTLGNTVAQLRRWGHQVKVISPDQFPTFPNLFYPEIALAITPFSSIRRDVEDFHADAIHIATEGPIGWAVRGICRQLRLRFTTSYHTKFPEYFRAHAYIPEDIGYRMMARFHASAAQTMVSTPSLRAELLRRGFSNLVTWRRGVNLDVFRPIPDAADTHAVRPVCAYVGRVSPEKNIEAFLNAPLPGSKHVVGGGPLLDRFKKSYPGVKFSGPLSGDTLAAAYSDADVLVFPSKTDTFGLVIIEALACGIPVAGYPVTGPIDILTAPGTGAVNEDLVAAVEEALATGDPAACQRHAATYTWQASTREFLSNLAPCRARQALALA